MLTTVARTRRLIAGLSIALTFLAVFTLNTSRAGACPAPPTLSDRIERSDWILVGTINESLTRSVDAGNDETWEEAGAAFSVDTVLKGEKLSEHHLTLWGYEFAETRNDDDRGSLDRAIVFCYKNDAADGAASLRASKVFAFDSFAAEEALTQAIAEYLALPDQNSGDRIALRTEWVVRLTENEHTRSHGIYELQGQPLIRITSVDENGDENDQQAFTDDQISRLLFVVNSGEAASSDLISLAGYLLELQCPEAEDWLIRQLRKPDPESAGQQSWMMYMLADYAGWQSGLWLAGQIYQTSDEEEPRRLVAKFLELYPDRVELPEALQEDQPDAGTGEGTIENPDSSEEPVDEAVPVEDGGND